MARFNLRKFNNRDWLQSISPARLNALISPWAGYLGERGFTFPHSVIAEPDYTALANVLMTPDASTPVGMIDALYYVHETSSPEDVEELQKMVIAKGLSIMSDPDATPTDYVIDVWVADADLVRQHHAEALARQQQNFEYFAGRHGGRWRFPSVDENVRLKIETELDDWFEVNRRGRGCHLLIFPHTPQVWILVRHGKSMRREASHEDDGSAGTAFYRPQLHDVMIYDEKTNEIGVHAETKGAGKLYLRVLGQHLFGDVDYFPPADKYTLSPLADQGREALACDDIEGIDEVRLTEYRRFWGGKYKEMEVRRATDIFGALEQRGDGRKIDGKLSTAVFKIKFTDAPRERRLVIRTPASAHYDRNDDSIIVEAWLRARGFMLARLEGPRT